MLNTVWCIDDDKIALMISKKVLLSANFCKEVNLFLSAKDALQKIYDLLKENNLPDLIFLDLNMPVMDGWQFLEDLDSNHGEFVAKVPVAILSSSLEPMDRIKAQHYENVVDFIKKPISVDVLVNLREKLGLN